MSVYRMARHTLLCLLLTIVSVGWPHAGSAASLLSNGDFEAPVALAGWTPKPPSAVSEPTGEFAVIAPTNGSGLNSLEQGVTSALPLGSFSFDFVFATEASPTSTFPQGVFPDSFFVSICVGQCPNPPGTPGDLLDVLFIDAVLGVDTSGFSSFIPTAGLVTLDSNITIPDFAPGLSPGLTTSGRVILDLSDPSFASLTGVPLTVAFDILDQADGFRTVVAIDHVTLMPGAATAVPEPGTWLWLGSTLMGLVATRLRWKRFLGHSGAL